MARVDRISKESFSSWQEAMAEFLFTKQGQGAAARTIQDYKYHITLFFSRFPSAWQTCLKHAVFQHLGGNIAPATYNLRRKYLKGFFAWCLKQGIISSNPLDGISKKKDRGRVHLTNIDTLVKLLQLPDQGTWTGLRDYTLMLITLDTAIRPSEALALKVEDIDFAHNVLHIRWEVSKTKEEAYLPVNVEVIYGLQKLVRARHPEWGTDAPLFCTRDGKTFKLRRWQARMRKYSEVLGVSITPYSLRHAFGTLFVGNGGNAFALQKIMRHKTMDMTRKYVELSKEDVKIQHALASPVKKILFKKPRLNRI